MSASRVWECGPISVRIDLHNTLLILFLCAAVLSVSVLSISLGDYVLSVRDVFSGLIGYGGAQHDFIVNQIRLPRILTALFVGMSLGVSGTIFQSLTRNPLASPDIIGFNAGAAFGATFVIMAFGLSSHFFTAGAISGGLLAAAIVFVLSLKDMRIVPYRLVLIGIGVGVTAYAGVDFLITRSDIFSASQAIAWLVGSLNAKGWDDVFVAFGAAIFLIPVALFHQRHLDRIEFGEEIATTLGINVSRTRLIVAIVGVLLVSVCVSIAGPIPFIALISGPIARRISKSAGPCILLSGLVGGCVLILADLVARQIIAPNQLPVGIFTAIIGAPFLLWMIIRQVRKGLM